MAQDQTRVLEALKGFIVRELLEGKDAGLDATSPLLEWGIIQSFALVSLTAFITQEFGVVVPTSELTPQNLENLDVMSKMVVRLAASKSA